MIPIQLQYDKLTIINICERTQFCNQFSYFNGNFLYLSRITQSLSGEWFSGRKMEG